MSALAQLGWQVTVLDGHAAPAQGSSGNLAGLYHGTVHEDDGPYARLYRAATLVAHRQLRPLIDAGMVPGGQHGLLRLDERDGALARLQRLVQSLPDDYVQVLDAHAASAAAGVRLAHPAWFYPCAGWVDPAALVRWLMHSPGIQFIGSRHAAALRRADDEWVVDDEHQCAIASAPVLVLANADGALPLLGQLGHADWPLKRFRGQVSYWPKLPAHRLNLPIAGLGYAIPLDDGGLLCGATSSEDDDASAPRRSDHDVNVQRLALLCGVRADAAAAQGRVGWRVQAIDRLPIVGPLPLSPAHMPSGQRMDQARLLARTPGLFVNIALGGRGITLAPLLGQLLAAQISGLPLPLEQGLVDTIDPGRWLVRKARRPAE